MFLSDGRAAPFVPWFLTETSRLYDCTYMYVRTENNGIVVPGTGRNVPLLSSI
jgi:hypothetical protein